jgi:hypothetical protein
MITVETQRRTTDASSTERLATLSLALSVLSFMCVWLAYLVFGSDSARPLAMRPVGTLAMSTAVGMSIIAVILALVSFFDGRGRLRPLRVWSVGTDALMAGTVMLACNAALLVNLRAQRAHKIEMTEHVAVELLEGIARDEQSYANENGGYYDSLECLSSPCRCLPRCQPPYASYFADPGRRSAGSAYHTLFYPGPPATDLDPKRHSLSSLASFALVSQPFGERPELRAFCFDSSRGMCVLPREDAQAVKGGRCPVSCMPWKQRD